MESKNVDFRIVHQDDDNDIQSEASSDIDDIFSTDQSNIGDYIQKKLNENQLLIHAIDKNARSKCFDDNIPLLKRFQQNIFLLALLSECPKNEDNQGNQIKPLTSNAVASDSNHRLSSTWSPEEMRKLRAGLRMPDMSINQLSAIIQTKSETEIHQFLLELPKEQRSS